MEEIDTSTEAGANQTRTIGRLAMALSKAQGAMKAALFDRDNPGFHFRYATLASVWDAIRGPLSQNELAVSQDAIAEDGRVGVLTTLMHSSGEWKRSRLLLKPTRDDPQGAGSALTYARRYALSAIVGAVGDEDDEGNEASKPGTAPKAAQARPQPAQRPATAPVTHPSPIQATVRNAEAHAKAAESAPVAAEVVSVKKLTVSDFWAGARELGYDTGTPEANDIVFRILGLSDGFTLKGMGYRVALDKLRLAAAKAPTEHGEPVAVDS